MKTYKAVYKWGGQYRCVTFGALDDEEAKKNKDEIIKSDIATMKADGPFLYINFELVEEVNEPDKSFRTIKIRKRIG